ncbi:HMG-box, partial [Daedalea quercina L-15889]
MPTKPATVPRPPNPFICYRSEVMRLHKAEGRAEGLLQTELSKRVGREWRELDAAARAPYEKMAEEKKEEHARAYPGYKYQPRRKGE